MSTKKDCHRDGPFTVNVRADIFSMWKVGEGWRRVGSSDLQKRQDIFILERFSCRIFVEVECACLCERLKVSKIEMSDGHQL